MCDRKDPASQLTSRAANYHNLNSSTEGGRMFNFMLADLSGALGDDKTILERLEAVLADPPRGEAAKWTRTVVADLQPSIKARQ